MDWINSANVIASLVLAIFGIGGYVFGIITYLKKKASPKPQEAPDSAPTQASPTPTIAVKPLSLNWMDWTDLFVQGLVEMADFILGTLFPNEYKLDMPSVNKIGLCLLFCFLIMLMAEMILGIILGIFLSLLSVPNPAGAVIAFNTTLLFTFFLFIYIYHVGRLVERKQKEANEKSQMKQAIPQSVK